MTALLVAAAGVASVLALRRGPSSSPAAAPTSAPSPETSSPRAARCEARGKPVRFVFDFAPGVSATDRAHVRRGVRLGRKAFGLRNTFCYRDDVQVTVLDRRGPAPARISAWSIGGEISLFADSDDWEASPLVVRLETMLHEMYHVVQHYRGGVNQPEPHWLYEGSAVWAAARAAARAGLYPSYQAAVGPIVIDAEPSDLRRAETPHGWNRLGRPYGLALAATEALLEGRRDPLERLDAYWRLLDEHNVGRTDPGTLEWTRAFREAFGIRPARFYARLGRVLEARR